MAILKVKDLSFRYEKKLNPVLTNLSFSIRKKETIGLIGPNGAGKTTLLLLISGALKPERGEIIFAGQKVKPNKFNPQIGYLFSNPDHQLFNSSVLDEILFGLTNMGISHSKSLEIANTTLKKLQSHYLINKAPHKLSHGEKKKVAFASILAMTPSLYLIDEPTGGLDIFTRRLFINLLNQIPKAKVIASHDLEFLLEVSDHIILLDNRKLIAKGKPSQLLGNEELMIKHKLEKPHSLIPHHHFQS